MPGHPLPRQFSEQVFSAPHHGRFENAHSVSIATSLRLSRQTSVAAPLKANDSSRTRHAPPGIRRITCKFHDPAIRIPQLSAARTTPLR